MLGSLSIAVNSLTGPAMLSLPATFARSGIIPTTITLVVVCALSALCCLHLANTISKVPHNQNFSQEVEFSQAFAHFWGRKWFWITQILFFGCITCLNISSIVDTGQVVDTFFGHWSPFGTIALRVGGPNGTEWLQWDYSICSHQDLLQGNCLPFQPTSTATNQTTTMSLESTGTVPSFSGILFSIGDVVTSLFFLPLALLDLKENSLAQIAGFFVLLLTSAQFMVQFMSSKHFSLQHLSWWGHSWKDLLGVVLFNFCLVIVIPSWLYEREPHVNVATVIHSSSLLSLGLYLALGILGSSMPHVSDNMLESIMSGSMGIPMELGGSLFAFAIIGLGIPLFSVLTRLNLLGSGAISSRHMANVLAVYLPFAVAWCLDSGHAVTQLLSWGGIAFTGLVAFVLPLWLALDAVGKSSSSEEDNDDNHNNHHLNGIGDDGNGRDRSGDATTIPSLGSIPVYGGYWTTKRAQIRALYGLLALTTVAIVAALAGLIVAPEDVPERIRDLVVARR